jgi:hypothetical protein
LTLNKDDWLVAAIPLMGKELLVPNEKEADTSKRKISIPLMGIKSQFLSYPAHNVITRSFCNIKIDTL